MNIPVAEAKLEELLAKATALREQNRQLQQAVCAETREQREHRWREEVIAISCGFPPWRSTPEQAELVTNWLEEHREQREEENRLTAASSSAPPPPIPTQSQKAKTREENR